MGRKHRKERRPASAIASTRPFNELRVSTTLPGCHPGQGCASKESQGSQDGRIRPPQRTRRGQELKHWRALNMVCGAVCRHSGPQGSIEPFTVVDDPSAWLAADYQGKEDSFIYTLTPEDIRELDAAIALVEKNGLRIEVRCHVLHACCAEGHVGALLVHSCIAKAAGGAHEPISAAFMPFISLAVLWAGQPGAHPGEGEQPGALPAAQPGRQAGGLPRGGPHWPRLPAAAVRALLLLPSPPHAMVLAGKVMVAGLTVEVWC